MNIPQWKKELVQRKQQYQQQKCGGHTQLSYPATKPPNNQQSHSSSTRSGTNEQREQSSVSKVQHVENHCTTDDIVNLPNNCCNLTKQPSLTSSQSNLLSVCKQCPWCSKMVKNTSVLVEETRIKMPNNIIHENNKNDESDSDSMEELQYGPGIVNKLKCRYLSLTLRETKIKTRPSLLRRATSLEHILDEPVVSEEDELESHNSQRNHKENNTDRLFISHRDAPGGTNVTNTRISRQNRYNSNRGDSMKRARSVETLIRYNSLETQSENNVMHMSVNENIVIIEKDDLCPKKHFEPEIIPKTYDIITPKINRPKRITPLMDETERPPAEIVKTKLKIFESTAKKFRTVKPVGEVAVKVDKFRTIIENDKAKKKPIIKPKPAVDKLNNKSSLLGKKITNVQEKPVCRPVSVGAKLYQQNSIENGTDKILDEPVKCTIETIKPDEELKSRPDISKITELFEKTSLEHHEPPVLPRLSTQTSQTRSQNDSSAKNIVETPPLSLPSSPTPQLNGSASETSEDILDTSANFPKTENIRHSPVPESKSTQSPSPENGSRGTETPQLEESDNAPSKSASDDESEDTFYSCDGSKSITKLALDNISTASTTMHFRFEANPKTKSYLPGVNPAPKPPPRTILATTSTIAQTKSQNNIDIFAAETTKNVIEIPNSSLSNSKFPLKWSHQETVTQVIRKDERNHIDDNEELLLDIQKSENLITNNKMESVVKTEQLVLTNREIEKNLINSVKTLQQQTLVTSLPPSTNLVTAPNRVVPKTSTSDVVEDCFSVTNHSGNSVSSDTSSKSTSASLQSSIASANNQTTSLWQKPWHQQQSNTMVFNFSHRKEVPDYIENDGIIRRPKREKPKPGEGGIIILADAPEDESCTDDFDDAWALRGPPSPCDVEFENDNILIDGKSCFISKFPKRQKLKIQFDDAATATYEYPSESSLMDESSSSSTSSSSLIAISTANNNTGSSTVSSAAHPSLGTKLQNYTPSKVVLNAEYFQLGVTRTSQPTSVPLRSSSPTPKNYENENSHLKPSAEVDNVSWGSETVPDLLF